MIDSTQAACPSCAEPLRSGARFCRTCGTAVTPTAATTPPANLCPSCAKPVRTGARFCRVCGAAVEPATEVRDAPAAAAASLAPARPQPRERPRPPEAPAASPPAARPPADSDLPTGDRVGASLGRFLQPVVLAPLLVLVLMALVLAIVAGTGSESDDRTATRRTTAAEPPPATSQSPESVSDGWPSETSAYSVMLASMTTAAGAQEMQRRANRAGLEAAILRSDLHPDLRPGYWVVFSGVYSERGSEAESAVEAARAAGFDDAYLRRVNAATEPEEEASGAVAQSGGSRRDEAPGFHRVTRSAYTVSIPDGWNVDSRDDDHGGYVEDRWHELGAPKVVILVDHTEGFTGTPREGASEVRGAFTNLDGYSEIAYESATIRDADAWRWEFEYKGSHTVDTFLTACDTGYAILVRAPIGRYADKADEFDTVIASLTPTC